MKVATAVILLAAAAAVPAAAQAVAAVEAAASFAVDLHRVPLRTTLAALRQMALRVQYSATTPLPTSPMATIRPMQAVSHAACSAPF
jgi:hypothetical protein